MRTIRTLFLITLVAFTPLLMGQWGGVLSASRASGAVTYAFYENFETPTTGYDNTGWGTGGSPNPIYATAPAPLQGTQSLRLPTSAQINRSISGGTIYLFFELNVTTWADFENMIEILNGGFGTVFKLTTWTPDTLRIVHGAVQAVGTTHLSTGTTYYIWIDYTKGTGADGVANLYISTTLTKPGSPEATVTTGTATTDVASIYFGQASTAVYIMDHIIHNPTVIGSNP